MMNIVHYVPRLSVAEGGVVRSVLDIAAATAAREHSVTVLTHDSTDMPDAWHQAGSFVPSVTVAEWPRLPGRVFSPGQLRSLKAVIRAADVLHLHTAWTTANAQLAYLARRVGTPYVVTLHGVLDTWSMQQRYLKKYLYLQLVARRMLDLSAAVHCTARAEREQAMHWLPRSSLRVIPLILDLAPFRSLPGEGEAMLQYSFGRGLEVGHTQPPIVLFLSRIHEKKGLDVLLRSCARLHARGVPFQLLVAGVGAPAYERVMHDLARSLGIGPCVHFLGLVTGTAKISLYQAARVLALPTSQENFGLVFPEALASGTPVITTKGVDIWPELLDSGGAIVCDRDENEFADAIETLLYDSGLASRMGSLGRNWALSSLGAEHVLESYEQLYQSCMVDASSSAWESVER